MKALTVCVDYADLLQRTLPQMLRWFENLLVVTSIGDRDTWRLVLSARRAGQPVSLLPTSAFTADGADFNKGRAIAEAWLWFHREPWACLIDADVLLPEPPLDLGLTPGCIHGARRRLCDDPAQYEDGQDFSQFPLAAERGIDRVTRCPGFFQVFSPWDPILASHADPYPRHWPHAGGADSDFCDRWPPKRRIVLPLEVLHFGPTKTHWHGRRPLARPSACPTDV